MDYRRMYDDNEMLYAYDLEEAGNRDVIVVIEKVYRGELVGEKGRKTKKPFVTFVGRSKKLALNKTNGKAIAKMYGKDADKWPGNPIALYVTTTEMDGETRDCIRVRNQRPEMPAGKGGKRGGNGAGGNKPDLAKQIENEMDRQASAPADVPSETTVPRATDEDDDISVEVGDAP